MPHASYAQLLKNRLPEIQKHFDVHFFKLPGEKHKLLRLQKIDSPEYPLLAIMAGCHGEEPAPVLALFQYSKVIAQAAKKAKINLVVYPLVNPWGFDRNIRENRQGLNCNRNYIHYRKTIMAKEARIVSKDLDAYSPSVFMTLHEDDEIRKGFYFFSFGDKKYERPLLDVGKKYFPVIKDHPLEDGALVKNGIAYEHHDGTAEDMMSHRCLFSCCMETSSFHPLRPRIQCARDWVLSMIHTHACLSPV